MTLPPDVKVALSLLQIFGLLIPVIFIAIRPYLTLDPWEVQEMNKKWKKLRRTEIPLLESDHVPDVVIAALGVIFALSLGGVFAAFRVLQYLWGSWLVSAAVLALVGGIAGLCILLYLIRLEFKSEIEGV